VDVDAEYRRVVTPRRLLLALALCLVGATGIAVCPGPGTPAVELDLAGTAFTPLDRPVDWQTDVKPVLDGRCVVCHACYDAPCQLLLSSYEGAERGATAQPVYDSTRLREMSPTRLHLDANDTAAWRERDFFPVLGPPAGGASGPGSGALLLDMLALGRISAFAEGERLPQAFPLDIDRKLSCPAPDETFDYAREHPQGGMPYGMAGLSDGEIQILASWLAQGPTPPPEPGIPAPARAQVERIEAFLNGDSPKERLVARYLYEHWFLAHLALPDLPAGPFFEVVRSRTPPGAPLDVIATTRPYDDPGVARVFYRLRPIRDTIVHKTHVVYQIGDAKLGRLRELFLDVAWEPGELPGHSPEEAANPFVAFAEIPAKSRYQFLLDDAHYFVMTFIRGPVCRGQVAVDVIDDHFWIAFADPDHDLAARDPAFLAGTKHLLGLPAELAGRIALPGQLWLGYNLRQLRYLETRVDYYDAIDPRRLGPALDWIWDGDEQNTNALLTVFRNFDNASVVRGFVGSVPETAWVVDYPIFERIYYNLVAGFDIFGNLTHQVSTRLYMDHLRMQSENLFLGLLPADRREVIRDAWYAGAGHQLSVALTDRLRALDHGTRLPFTGGDPVAEALALIEAHAGAAAGPPDLIHRCARPPCDRPDASPVERRVERELARLAPVRGGVAALLPEISLLRVRVDAGGERDLVYAIVHNAAHTNVAFMFDEEERRVPADDTLTLVRGHFGSYPNFFFEVEAEGVAAFVDALLAARDDADLERIAARHGIRRTSARFWETVDWLHADLRRRDPVQAGLYDLARYVNL
jgi:hypothetical protein